MARLLFASAIKRACPPWLQRTHGGRLMVAFGEQLDELVDRMAASIKLRFPGLYSDETLPLLAAERRIRRGPGEPAATFANRLLGWLDDHRTRGGPYALLRQLRAYIVDTLPVRVDVVDQNGKRVWMDAAGVITRDAIAWTGHGNPSAWAHVWVFFYLTASQIDALNLDALETDTGAAITTHSGAEIEAQPYASGSGSVTDETAEFFLVVPREWSAAHLPYITVVLLYGDAELWGYPPGSTWGSGTWAGAITLRTE